MGDRGNIIVKDGSSTVYLYTHWTGSDLPETIKGSLARAKDRWNDGPYLARVLFQDMLNGDTGLTGFGISSEMGDGGTDIVVSVDGQEVQYGDRTVSFPDFIAA
jgi:hypothetical protein